MKNFLQQHGPEECIRRILPWIWLAGCFAVYTYFMWVYGEQLLDSDNSTELVYTALLAEENSLLSDTWWYSTEIRILYFHLVMIPLFKVFTDWHVIRTIGSVINNLIMLLCYGYFCRGADLRREYAVSAAMLILPLSEVFFKYTAYGLQYTSYISIGFITFGLLLRMKDEPGKRRIPRMIFLLLLSFLNGMAGLREFLVLYIPLVLMAVVCWWFSRYDRAPGRSVSSARLAGNSLICTCAAGAGYLVNIRILANRYSFADYGDMMHYVSFSLEQLETCLDGIFKNFGYHQGKVLSGYTLLNLMFGILLLLALNGVIAGLRRLAQGIIDVQTQICVFYVIATALYIILYMFTTMDCYDRYYIPICAFSIPTAVYGVRGWMERHTASVSDSPESPISGSDPALQVRTARIFPHLNTIALILFMAVMTGFATLKYYYLHSGDEDETYYHRELAELLIREGYTDGWSTYSGGGIMVELTDAAVNMHVMPTEDIQSDGNIENLLALSQRKDVGDSEPEGKCFLLFETDQMGSDSLSAYLDESHVIYSSWKIVAYGYDSYEELLLDLGTFSYEFSEDYGYLSDGEDFMGERILDTGTGSSGGPMVTLYAGTYRITITGDNLDQAAVSCTWGERAGALEIFDVSVEEEEIVFYVRTEETLEDCEIVIDNPSEEYVILEGVTVERQPS